MHASGAVTDVETIKYKRRRACEIPVIVGKSTFSKRKKKVQSVDDNLPSEKQEENQMDGALLAGRPQRSQKTGCGGTGWPTGRQRSGAAACPSQDSVSLSGLTMRHQPRRPLQQTHFITLKSFLPSSASQI